MCRHDLSERNKSGGMSGDNEGPASGNDQKLINLE